MIKFTKSPTGAPHFLAYNQGDEVELSESAEEALVEAKLAVKVDQQPDPEEPQPDPEEPQPKTEKATNTKAQNATKR